MTASSAALSQTIASSVWCLRFLWTRSRTHTKASCYSDEVAAALTEGTAEERGARPALVMAEPEEGIGALPCPKVILCEEEEGFGGEEAEAGGSAATAGRERRHAGVGDEWSRAAKRSYEVRRCSSTSVCFCF